MNIENELKKLESKLLEKSNFIKIEFTKEWILKIPSKPGVYVISEKDKIIYVGETGNLQGRMKDLFDTRHHSLRRTLGRNLFINNTDFLDCSIKLKFPTSIEILLNKYVKKNLLIAYQVVEFGRKELEEKVENSIDIKTKLNKRGKRK